MPMHQRPEPFPLPLDDYHALVWAIFRLDSYPIHCIAADKFNAGDHHGADFLNSIARSIDYYAGHADIPNLWGMLGPHQSPVDNTQERVTT